MRTLKVSASAALAASGVIGFGVFHGVSAHDVHTFGPYTVALGWVHEPAYVGFDNAVQFLVKDAKGNPVTGLDGLTVDVSLDTAAMTGVKLVETADPDTGLGTPGDYEANFIPTAPGNYTFHVKGTINGTAVDDNVTASPSTFDEVRTDDTAEFPSKVPAISDLSTKIDAVSNRVDPLPAQVTSAQQGATTGQSAASDAKDAANRALVVGIVALVLGVLLGVANLVIGLRRSRART